MDDNKNEKERAKYTQLISEKELAVDDLKEEQRKLQENLRNLQAELHKGYQELASLDEEGAQKGDMDSIQRLRKNEAQARTFQNQLMDSENELSESYSKEYKKIEKETEELYQKRSDIPWD